jgi:hypothetical protein
MRGMGAGSRVLASPEEYQLMQRPGHMWMPLLEGEQISSDVAIANGEPRWWRHAIGHPLGLGMFDYWTVLTDARPELEAYCGRWIRHHFAGYTGMINIETIGGKIIEAHLRFADQWPDIYGPGWVEALIRLYAEGRWEFDDSSRRLGYSVVLFGAHGVEYKHPPKALVESILTMPTVTSVQITFHEDRPPGTHSMPPGGFRLCIVNCWDLEVGFAARERLALSFWPTPGLRAQRRTRYPDAVDRAHG